MNNLAEREKIVHIDALPLHKKYSKMFHMDDVPESERKETAQLTSDKILEMLKSEKRRMLTTLVPVLNKGDS